MVRDDKNAEIRGRARALSQYASNAIDVAMGSRFLTDGQVEEIVDDMKLRQGVARSVVRSVDDRERGEPNTRLLSHYNTP